MPTPKKTELETSELTTNPTEEIQAAIDPTGGVRALEAPADSSSAEKLEAAIDPTGGVKKTNAF